MQGSLEKIRKGVSSFANRCCCCRSSSVDVEPRNNSKSKSLKSRSLLSVCHKSSNRSTPTVTSQGNRSPAKTCSYHSSNHSTHNAPAHGIRPAAKKTCSFHSTNQSTQNAAAQGIRPAAKTSSVPSSNHSMHHVPAQGARPAAKTSSLHRNTNFIQPVPPQGIRPAKTRSYHSSYHSTQYVPAQGIRPAAKTFSHQSYNKPPSPKHVQSHGDSDYSSFSSSSSSEFSIGELPVVKAKTEATRSPSRVSIASYIAEFEETEVAIRMRHLTIMERYRRIPLTNLIGRENQWSVQGKYSGNQCTVMALTAAAYQHFRPMAFWDRDIMDKVVWTGDYHHTLFRDSLEYSTNVDHRIALDELPSTIRMTFGEPHDVNSTLTMYVGQHSGLLFLSNTRLNKCFERPTLKDYIEAKAANLTDAAFVITINQYSHSIVKEDNYWYLYDSHGSMRVPTPVFDQYGGSTTNLGHGIKTGATLTRFDMLSTLIGVLQQNQPPGSPCEARLVTAIPSLSLDFDDKKVSAPPRRIQPQPQGGATYRVGTPARISAARLISNHDVADVDPEDVITLD